MKIALPYGNTLSDVWEAARKRGILPTWMGTAELRELEAAIKERAVFSARTTNAVYLEALRERIMRLMEDGYDGDQAKLRLELKQILAELAYDPLTGFPGDAELGIEPAEPGSLRDLSSDRRINLILDTQLSLLAGKGQQQRGLEPAALELLPAWELVRIKNVRAPRDWPRRWAQAGGVVIQDDGRLRMVAAKTDDIWRALGDTALFSDALGVSYPPFCFNSGMAWEAVERDEWERLLKLMEQPGQPPVSAPEVPGEVKKLPPATVSTHGMSRGTLLELRGLLRNSEAANGRLTLKSVFSEAPPPPPPSRPRVNAALLLKLADLCAEINGRRRGHGREQRDDGVKCGKGHISKNKKCHKGVALLSSDERLTSDEAADALESAPHHHLFHAVRHWFDKSYRRLNQQPGSKETLQLKAFLSRIEPTPLEVPLYRGMRFKTREELAAFAAKVKRGEWPDMPVTAFSKNARVAAKFAAPHRTDEGRFEVVMKLSRSKSGRDMRPLADVASPSHAHQDEVVFLPGTKFVMAVNLTQTEGGMTAVITGHEE